MAWKKSKEKSNNCTAGGEKSCFSRLQYAFTFCTLITVISIPSLLLHELKRYLSLLILIEDLNKLMYYTPCTWIIGFNGIFGLIYHFFSLPSTVSELCSTWRVFFHIKLSIQKEMKPSDNLILNLVYTCQKPTSGRRRI